MATTYVSAQLGGGVTAGEFVDDPNNTITLREQLGIQATPFPLLSNDDDDDESNGSIPPIREVEAHLRTFESRRLSDSESIIAAKAILGEIGDFINTIGESGSSEKVFDMDVDDLTDHEDTVVVLNICYCPVNCLRKIWRHKVYGLELSLVRAFKAFSFSFYYDIFQFPIFPFFQFPVVSLAFLTSDGVDFGPGTYDLAQINKRGGWETPAFCSTHFTFFKFAILHLTVQDLFFAFHRYHRWYFDLAFAFSSIALLHCLDFILFFGFCFAV